MKYTVKGAAAATGVAEDRLRTWERRYGVPRPARSPTGRRQYDERDLAVIRRMAALIDAGVSAVDAAEAALDEDAGEPPAAPPAPDHPLVGALLDAAAAYDEPTARRLLDEARDTVGWDDACALVLFPALARAGERWRTGAFVTAQEHFLSEVIRRQLSAAIATQPVSAGTPAVLLAAPERERHDLGLLALSLLLRRRNVRDVFFGADVPVADLLAALAPTGARAICLAAVTSAARAALELEARTIVADGRARHLFVGGPAVLADAGGAAAQVVGVLLPANLPAAADLIAATLQRDGAA